MQHLIKDRQRIENDAWIVVDKEADVPTDGPVILPLKTYQEQQAQWRESERSIGVWLDEDEMADDVADALDDLELIAIAFPKFADGRGFSKARLLRERLGFSGEIRAIGDFLPDQVFYMYRCGVNAFACRSDSEAETTLSLLDTFSVRYQADVDAPPLFNQR